MERDTLREWGQFLLTYKFAIDEVSTKISILNEEMQFIHDTNPIEHMKSRLKTPQSIIDKLKRKNQDTSVEKAKLHIRDIAGIRVICSFSSDVYKVYDMIARQHDVKVLEVKDYVKKPKPNGYQSLHLIVEIPVFLTERIEHVAVEIQIRTVAMDFWASLEHKIYYKYSEMVPDHTRDQLKECAEMISILDRRMQDLSREVLLHQSSILINNHPAGNR